MYQFSYCLANLPTPFLMLKLTHLQTGIRIDRWVKLGIKYCQFWMCSSNHGDSDSDTMKRRIKRCLFILLFWTPDAHSLLTSIAIMPCLSGLSYPQEKLDFAMNDIVFDLLGVGRSSRQISPEVRPVLLKLIKIDWIVVCYRFNVFRMHAPQCA